MSKKILVLDFDGVIHSYSSGWQGADVANDPPVPGAAAAIYFYNEVFEVHVFGSRSADLLGVRCMHRYVVDAMHEYFKTLGKPAYQDAEHWVNFFVHFPAEKPPAFLTIDDRAICFDGTWPDLGKLANFQPWHKLPKTGPTSSTPA